MIAAAIAPAFAVSEMERMAKAISKSGLFGVKTVDQALALMLIAQAEGRHPASAARDYDIIDGRPAKKAEAMLRDFLAAGGKVEWLELTDEVCRATFSHPFGGSATIDWTIKRATRAQIASPMWKKYPRQMLRSRAVSEGVRTVYPMATSGMYVEEEVRDLAPEAASGPSIAPPPAEPIEVQAEPDQDPPVAPAARKSARQLKADGEDERIRVWVEACDLAELLEWEALFDTRTDHLPRAWLDPIRDWIALRREEILFDAACAEMDAEYAAAVG